MADFCNKCSEDLFGKEVTPEINVHTIGESLSEDTWEMVLCEGCGMQAVGKSSTGEIFVALPTSKFEDDPRLSNTLWVNLRQYEAGNFHKSNNK
jgi:hypothetical protein